MGRFFAAAYWTLVLLTFTFFITIPLLISAAVAAWSRHGRALRAQGWRARLLVLAPSAITLALWAWASLFADRGALHTATADVVALKTAAGWRYSGIMVLIAIQVIATAFIPFALRAGRLAGWAYGALQLWIGAMAWQLAYYAVLGLPVPVL